jgi:hypothetical protein
MASTDVVEKVTLTIADYRRMVDICIAADIFVSSQTAQALEELRDALLTRVDLID